MNPIYSIWPVTRLAVLVPALVVAACASNTPPTFSESVRSEGTHMVLVADSWEEGKKMVRKGEKLQRQASEQQADGQVLQREGQDQVDKARSRIRDSQASYHQTSLTMGHAETSKAVHKEAGRLSQIADSWEDAEELLKDGEDNIAKGRKYEQDAEKQLSRAQGLIDSGKRKVQSAELSYRNAAASVQAPSGSPANGQQAISTQ